MDKKYTIKFVKHEAFHDYVEYTILIKDSSNESWAIKSRYSQLRQLDKRIKEVLPIGSVLPKFPGKKLFGNLDPSFISQRQKALENYFNTLLSNEHHRKLDVIYKFFYESPRIVINNGSLLKKDSNDSYLQDSRKKSNDKDNYLANDGNPTHSAQIKYEKQTSNQGGLHLLIESINKKFFDLSYTLSPPDEEEAKKKKHQYEKLKLDIGQINIEGRLPVGKEDNLLVVKDESLATLNPELLRDLFETTKATRKEINLLGEVFKQYEIIHFVK